MQKGYRQIIPGLRFRRIVVKLGTHLLTGGTRHLDEKTMSGLISQISSLHQKGAEIIVVSSGAIASGRNRLGLNKTMKKPLQHYHHDH